MGRLGRTRQGVERGPFGLYFPLRCDIHPIHTVEEHVMGQDRVPEDIDEDVVNMCVAGHTRHSSNLDSGMGVMVKFRV